MKVFNNCLIILEFDSSIHFKEKLDWRNKIIENGGNISYFVTRQAKFLVLLTRKSLLSAFKVRQAEKLGIPVVKPEFINECLRKDQLLPVDTYTIGQSQKEKEFCTGKIKGSHKRRQQRRRKYVNLSAIPSWYIDDPGVPVENDTEYDLAKWILLKKDTTVQVLEIHTLQIPVSFECSQKYRLITQTGKLENNKMLLPLSIAEVWYFPSSDEAVSGYGQLFRKLSTSPYNMELCSIPEFVCHGVGSKKLQLILWELSSLTSNISQEVAVLVDMVWREAVDEASNILSMKIKHIKLEKVEAAEVALQQLLHAMNAFASKDKISSILEEFYENLPHKEDQQKSELTLKQIASKQDLCQLVRDILSVNEATDWAEDVTAVSKYRTLRCSIQQLEEDDDEFSMVENIVSSTAEHVKVKAVYQVSRSQEHLHFLSTPGNVQLLMHSSHPANFLGILSRGLLMPDAVVKNFGVTRTDAGMLGCGIYFSDSASTCAKYSLPNSQTGTRLLLLCDVTLGNCKDVTRTDTSLVSPPTGYHSVHGMKQTAKCTSQFKDDEYVIYDPNQQRVRYLVEFILPHDTVKRLKSITLVSNGKTKTDSGSTKIDISSLKDLPDPLKKLKSGLIGSRNEPVPLKSVHIRAKMLDLVSQVVVLQEYRNDNSSPIEAKFVFPLDDTAAVCGFEAFINNKHIIGQVKEKPQAHREYKEAVKKGHGAYLMDEEEPDVFSVSVGNLPPKSDVLIKITYVSELQVEGDYVRFYIPSSVAPWVKDTALAQQTQSTVSTVLVRSADQCKVTVQVAMEMPFEIKKIESPTHPLIKCKQTAVKAVVELPNSSQITAGFELLVKLSTMHVPRMWVEESSDQGSQACMLVFYPEFEAECDQDPEIIFLLDMSNSMKPQAAEDAKKVLLLALELMPDKCFFNVVTFGTTFLELFPIPQRKKNFTLDKAVQFVQGSEPKSGCSNAWHPLESLFLLQPSEGRRNILLISDGHLSAVGMMLSTTRKAAIKNRLFCLGVGSAVNHHLMKRLASAGGGGYEFYDRSSEYRWQEKIQSQLDKVRQPGLSEVKIDWGQSGSDGKLVQAPSHIPSLFNGSRQIIYGFIDNCRQATLQAEVDGSKFSLTLSTSDLSVTSGKILHQLTAKAVIRDYHEGIFANDKIQHQILKSERKQKIISLSKQYSIVTAFTSFVAIEERGKDEQIEKGLKIEQLIAKETVDNLEYIKWQEQAAPEDNKSAMELVDECLQKGEVAESFSILEAERQYERLLDYVEELEKTNNDNLRVKVLDVLKTFCTKTQSVQGQNILDVLLPSLKVTNPTHVIEESSNCLGRSHSVMKERSETQHFKVRGTEFEAKRNKLRLRKQLKVKDMQRGPRGNVFLSCKEQQPLWDSPSLQSCTEAKDGGTSSLSSQLCSTAVAGLSEVMKIRGRTSGMGTPLDKSTGESMAMPLIRSTGESMATPLIRSTGKSMATPLIRSAGKSMVAPLIRSTRKSKAMPLIRSTGKSMATPLIRSTGENMAMPLIRPTGESMAMPMIRPTGENMSRPLIEPMSECISMPSIRCTECIAVPLSRPTGESIAMPPDRYDVSMVGAGMTTQVDRSISASMPKSLSTSTFASIPMPMKSSTGASMSLPLGPSYVEHIQMPVNLPSKSSNKSTDTSVPMLQGGSTGATPDITTVSSIPNLKSFKQLLTDTKKQEIVDRIQLLRCSSSMLFKYSEDPDARENTQYPICSVSYSGTSPTSYMMQTNGGKSSRGGCRGRGRGATAVSSKGVVKCYKISPKCSMIHSSPERKKSRNDERLKSRSTSGEGKKIDSPERRKHKSKCQKRRKISSSPERRKSRSRSLKRRNNHSTVRRKRRNSGSREWRRSRSRSQERSKYCRSEKSRSRSCEKRKWSGSPEMSTHCNKNLEREDDIQTKHSGRSVKRQESRHITLFADKENGNQTEKQNIKFNEERNWGLSRFKFLKGFPNSETRAPVKPTPGTSVVIISSSDEDTNDDSESKRIKSVICSSTSNSMSPSREDNKGVIISSSNEDTNDDSESKKIKSVICSSSSNSVSSSSEDNKGRGSSEEEEDNCLLEMTYEESSMEDNIWRKIVIGPGKLNTDNLDTIFPKPKLGCFWELSHQIYCALNLNSNTDEILEENGLRDNDITTKTNLKNAITTLLVVLSILRCLYRRRFGLSYTVDMFQHDVKLAPPKLADTPGGQTVIFFIGHITLHVPRIFYGPMRWLQGNVSSVFKDQFKLPFGINSVDVVCKMLEAFSEYD